MTKDQQLISESLRELRWKLGRESQEVFGARFGLTFKTISRWELGERTPRGEILNQLADLSLSVHAYDLEGVFRYFYLIEVLSSNLPEEIASLWNAVGILLWLDQKENGPFTSELRALVKERFGQRHNRTFGFDDQGNPIVDEEPVRRYLTPLEEIALSNYQLAFMALRKAGMQRVTRFYLDDGNINQTPEEGR